jgi:SNF2 family DNA or RNA helicase
LEAVIEKLDEGVSEGDKIPVFSQYVRVLRMLERRIHRHEWNYRYLDGSLGAGKRKHLHYQLQGGWVGINLTEADYVFLVDPWWNPAVESQSIDRTHRIGQTKPVFAYRFLTTDTIAERVLELQDTKRRWFQLNWFHTFFRPCLVQIFTKPP